MLNGFPDDFTCMAAFRVFGSGSRVGSSLENHDDEETQVTTP